MKNGARIDQAAIAPPIAGPLIPPSRKPPVYRPLARPRSSGPTLLSSKVCAPMPKSTEPRPPTPRSTSSAAKELENPASTLLTATTRMPIAIARRWPIRSISRPPGSAPTIRMTAKALMTLPAAATLTPN